MITVLVALAGGFGYWIGGYAQIQPPAAYDNIKGAGYPQPGSSGLLSGGEGYALIGKLVIGGGGFGIGLFGGTSPDYNSSAGVSGGYFSLGYVLFANDNMLLFPTVGMGGGGLEIIVNQSKGGSFDDLLRDPPTRIRTSSGGIFFKGGLTFLYRYSFILLGITGGGGYLLTSGWDINGNETTNYPQGNTPVFWIAVSLGGGWWGNKAE